MEIMLGKDFHEDDQIEIVLHSKLSINSSVKGYHAYKDIWTPLMNKKLAALMKPDNGADKYAVYFKKILLPASHPQEKMESVQKIFFPHVETNMQPEVIIIGRTTNLGDGDGMEVPYFLRITGKKDYIGILENKLIKYVPILL